MTNSQCELAMGDDGTDEFLENVMAEVKKCSMLAYLWNACKQPVKHTTTREVRATTHGSILGEDKELIKCLIGSVMLPAGTEGYLFTSEKHHYSEYVWVGDMQLPKIGADIISTGRYYSFLTFVMLDGGHEVLADAFASVDWPAKVVGKV